MAFSLEHLYPAFAFDCSFVSLPLNKPVVSNGNASAWEVELDRTEI